MSEDILKAKWKQLRGEIKSRWGKLTDDEIAQVEGERDRLVGLLQERYAMAKEDAIKEVAEYLEEINKRL